MNIYLISQNVNNGYDTYDAMVVAAETEERAKEITNEEYGDSMWYGSPWASFKDLKADLIGSSIDNEERIILKSFNAG